METKKEIRDLLKENLENGKQLSFILVLLKDCLQRDLSPMEDYYVKYKCLKYCLNSWVEQCTKQLQELEPEYLSDTLEDIDKLTVKALEPKQFPRELRILTQNRAHKVLENFCSNYIPQESIGERSIIVETFKSKIWNNILENVEEYRNAREYLENFQLLLTECGISKRDLITGLDLHSLELPFDDDDLVKLKEAFETMIKEKYSDSNVQRILAKLISLHEELFLAVAEKEKEAEILIVKQKLGLRLEYFVKPAKINLDQDTLTVCGCALSISEVYDEMLKYLEKSEVKEIHLYSPDVIIVDKSLQGDEFKGLNFVVSTTKLLINGNCIWDFSGRAGESAYSLNHSKAINPLQMGVDGMDGKAGESGGNVHILVSHIIGTDLQSNLHVRSIGGDGGNGQVGGEGGDGLNGEDGNKCTSIDEDKFKSMIPKVSRFNDKTSNKHQLKCYQALIDILMEEGGHLKENKSEYSPSGERFVYQSIVTRAGAEAGFSIYEGPIHTSAYGFHIWYFGSPGTEGSDGGPGGRGGRGGQAGYGGDIEIQIANRQSPPGSNNSTPRNSGQTALITVERNSGNFGKDGAQGKKGRPGKQRKPGKKGTDYACVHPFSTLHGRTFYKGALIKREEESKEEPSPYCGYAKSKIHFKNSQREVTRLKNEQKEAPVKARAPQKTSQKQRTIVKSETEKQFQHHCRRYFQNIDFQHGTGKINRVSLTQSSVINKAIASLQIASRICDFNPKGPSAPKRKMRRNLTRELGKKVKIMGTDNSDTALPAGTESGITLPPILREVEEIHANLADGEIKAQLILKELSTNIQRHFRESQDKSALTIEACQQFLAFLETKEEDGIFLTIRENLLQNLKYQVLHLIHLKMQLLSEIRIGKIQKLDQDFYLVFIKNRGELDVKYQSSTIHSEIAKDILIQLNAEERDATTVTNFGDSSTSQLFLNLKTSMLEKGLSTFPAFMDQLNQYTRKNVKKLSKHDPNVTKNLEIMLEPQSPPQFHRLNSLEQSFLQEYLEKEQVGGQHHGKIASTLSATIDDWLKKHDVLTDYVKSLRYGTMDNIDFQILAQVYNCSIRVYKTVLLKDEIECVGQLVFSGRNGGTITNITLKLMETETNNFVPLVYSRQIAHQQAEIFGELLDDASRPDYFDEPNFDLMEKFEAIKYCFLNRRSNAPLLPPGFSCNYDLREMDVISKDLSELLPELPKMVKLALLSSYSKLDCESTTGLLEALTRRLKWQGCHQNRNVSSTFIEMGLAILGMDKVDLCHLEWIVTSLPQRNWILEIAFILIQQIFRKSNKVHQYKEFQWKQQLAHLNPTGLVLLIDKIEGYSSSREFTSEELYFQNSRLLNIIDQVAAVVSETSLTLDDIHDELLELRLQDWPKQLINLKIRKTFKFLNRKWNENERDENYKKCIYYVSSLHNEFPSFVDNVLRVLNRIKKNSPKKEMDCEKLVEIFSNYYHGYWIVPTTEEMNFSQFDDSFDYFHMILEHQNESKHQKGERQRDDILKFITQDKNTTLDQMTLQRIKFELKGEPHSGSGFLDENLTKQAALTLWAKRVKNSADKPGLGEMLYCINEGIHVCKTFYLRDTQKVALVAMLQEDKRNVLAQVATGEGKSLIVVAWSIIKRLLGVRCDVVTSSSVLAERDALENKDVFDLFGVTVGHNSSSDVEDRKLAYKQDVVYGDVANFQRDYLLNKYYEKNILGERSSLENLVVMVDEVDSMLLDKGSSVLYLSHRPAGVEVLDSLFIYIWKTMNLTSNPEEAVTFEKIKKIVLSEMYTIINPEKLKCLETSNFEGIAEQIFEVLQDLGYLDEIGRYIVKDGNKPSLPENLVRYENATWYIIKSEEARKREFSIPKHLEEFVDLHLDAWIGSAFRALLQLKVGKEYIVDTATKSFITPDSDPKVIIVDRDTGVDLFQSQWNDGLHQFLQLKHQCAFSNLSLKAIFTSNISYFRKYYLIHGLTGTLGSEIERNFLKKTYSVEFINVPTATPKKFVEELPIVVGNIDDWKDHIIDKATAITMQMSNRRSVLIVCETINDADSLYIGFKNESKKRKSFLPLENIHVYKRSYEKFSIVDSPDKELGPGQVIISTNLAGRGTDIKISNELNENGGLFVILSYLPKNIRVEQQAFGRAARKGQNGSGILIVLDKNGSFWANQEFSDEVTMVDLKNDRDEAEIFTMSQIETEFESIIGYEESLFLNFSKLFQTLKPRLKEIYRHPTIREIVLDSIIDKWAFWLDQAVSKNLPLEKALKDLNSFISGFQGNESKVLNVLESPVHLISVGKIYLNKENWPSIFGTDSSFGENALTYFDKANQLIGNSCSQNIIPNYYKTFATLICSKLNQSSKLQINTSLRQVQRGFQTLIAEECGNIAAISAISERLCQTQSFIQVESFKDQRKNLINIYQLFIDSIGNALGQIAVQESPELLFHLAETKLIRNCSVINLPACNTKAVPNGVVNKLLYKRINPDLQLIEDIAFSYGIRYEELHQAIYELRELCGSKFNIQDAKIKSFLREKINLPSREEFWNALTASGVISNVMTVALVRVSGSKLIEEPAFKKLQIKDVFKFDVTGKVFYNPLTAVIPDLAFTISLSYNDALVCPELNELEKNGMIKLNLCGEWLGRYQRELSRHMEHHSSTKYYLKIEEAFEWLAESGVPSEFLNYDLMRHLVDQGIMQNDGLLLHPRFIEIDWGIYNFFKDELISVLQIQCIYRICFLQLHEQMKEGHSNLSFLMVDPYTCLLNKLYHFGILRKHRTVWPCTKVEMELAIEKYSSMEIQDIAKLFERINIPSLSVEAFWFHLVDKGWIKCKEIGDKTGKLVVPKNFKIEEPWNTKEIFEFLTARNALLNEKRSVYRALQQLTSILNVANELEGSLMKIETKLGNTLKQNMALEIMMVQSMGLDYIFYIHDSDAKILNRSMGSALNYLHMSTGIATTIYNVAYVKFSGESEINFGISDVNLGLENVMGLEECGSKLRMSDVAACLLKFKNRTGHVIISHTFLEGRFDSFWTSIQAGHQLGHEILKIFKTEINLQTDAIPNTGEKIKTKYNLLANSIEAKIELQIEDFMSSEIISNLFAKVGLDEARSELMMTFTEENFDEEWEQFEKVVDNYATNKLESLKKFDRKEEISKNKAYRKLFISDNLIEELWRPIHKILNICTESIRRRYFTQNNNNSSSIEKPTEFKYQQKVIVFELSKILSDRVKEIIHESLLLPILDTVSFRLSQETDASLVRQLSQTRKVLMKNISMKEINFKRNFDFNDLDNGKSGNQDVETFENDQIEELRLNRLCTKLLRIEEECTDPFLLSEFVGAGLSCNHILIQACANLYSCRIKVKEFEYPSGHLKKTDIVPLKPREAMENLARIYIDIPQPPMRQSLSTILSPKQLTAAQLLQSKEKVQRQVLDVLLTKLQNVQVIIPNVEETDEFTRDDLRQKLAETIKSDVEILVKLRNKRINTNQE